MDSNTSGSQPVIVKASGGASVTLDLIVNHYNHYHHESITTPTPSLEAIKQMIDAVIATTEDRATAARLEVCRAYLFNPLLGESVERLMFESLSPVESVVKRPAKRAKLQEVQL